jgi:CheY-like chemotaxis protein
MMDDEATTRNAQAKQHSSLDDGLILLVEDNVDDVELTLRAFERRGFKNRIVTLRDGVQALDYLRRRGLFSAVNDPWPSLILLDLKLPRVDGLEVLEQLKSDPGLRSVPVVMLTSSKHERDVDTAYSLGVNSFISKPTDFAQLLEVVDKIGDYWFGVVELPSSKPPPGKARSH